ncbi:hypothetical protein BDW22DRAFT_1351681 [Trametopsis cervina]|nr:hypothetical protein BDW22DRAFT_1351681 [Trametopsis cervina]
MFRLSSSKVPLRLLAAGVSSTRRPCCPLVLLNRSLTRNLTTSRLSSGRLYNMVDPRSLMEGTENELFDNTTVCKVLSANEALRLCERRRVFNISEFSPTVKLMESSTSEGLERVASTPEAYALASEVATMDYLRSKGCPFPGSTRIR